MTLTFPWSLSINTLVLLCRVMREWKVGFVGIFFASEEEEGQRGRGFGGQ